MHSWLNNSCYIFSLASLHEIFCVPSQRYCIQDYVCRVFGNVFCSVLIVWFNFCYVIRLSSLLDLSIWVWLPLVTFVFPKWYLTLFKLRFLHSRYINSCLKRLSFRFRTCYSIFREFLVCLLSNHLTTFGI